MLICTLDGNNITDKNILHDTLAGSLHLPDWYGRNLDALCDCLSDLQEETEIRLLHEKALEDHLGNYAKTLKKAVREVCQENPRIHFIEGSSYESLKSIYKERYKQMNLDHITVNTQNSIRIEGSKILYFDPFQVEDSRHDADIIFITHEHFDHFEPDSIAKVKKDSTLLAAPESMKRRYFPSQVCRPTSVYFTDRVRPMSKVIL